MQKREGRARARIAVGKDGEREGRQGKGLQIIVVSDRQMKPDSDQLRELQRSQTVTLVYEELKTDGHEFGQRNGLEIQVRLNVKVPTNGDEV